MAMATPLQPGRSIEQILRDMIGNQAIQIAGLTSSLEQVQAVLAQRTADLTAVQADLVSLKAVMGPVADAPGKVEPDGNPNR
jgi:hypothetical protein